MIDILEYAELNKLWVYWCKKYNEYYYSMKEITIKDKVLFPNAVLIKSVINPIN